MIRIPLSFKIVRDHKSGKKRYIDLETQQISTKPALPKGWESVTKEAPRSPGYVIKAGSDLIVIDCDDGESTQLIHDALVPCSEVDDGGNLQHHYITISDKGFKHYYFRPTQYYKDSIIYRESRLAIGKIDILHGRALVFPACALNETKDVYQGSEDYITPIPDNIVDLLSELRGKKAVEAQSDDYTPLTSYLAPTIDQALAMYARTKDYRDIENVLRLVTPSAYKHKVEPDFHPDRVPDGEGISYIQAMSAKIGRDPSISIDLHRELLTLITQELWSEPLPQADLDHHIKTLTTQTYSGTGQKVFVYDPNATAIPLVSVNNNPYMPVYRTLDDQYILAKPQGGVEVIKGLSNFKRAVRSKNYSLLVDGQVVKADAHINRAVENLDTLSIVNLTYKPPGVFEDDGSKFYNIYTPTRFLGIIRNSYLEDRLHRPGTTPTIDRILHNLVADHENPEEIVKNFEAFISHKLKTLDYSPIVFQIMGNRGIGKGLLMQVLEHITNATARIKLTASNNQFNADTAGKLFVNEDEGIVTPQVVNTLKELSGNQQTRIEGKGVDAYMSRNVATYIATTNKTTPLAETIDDRRFVTFSSFKAKRIEVDYNRLQLEIEEWCLRLREAKLTNIRLYVDANAWHDEVHKEAFKEKAETTEHVPSKIAHLIYTMKDISGAQLREELEDIFGEYHYNYVHSRQTLWIPLAKNTSPKRLVDGQPIPHSITHVDLKKVELAQYLFEDKSNNIYSKRYWRLKLTLEPHQADAFSDCDSNEVNEIDGDNIDI